MKPFTLSDIQKSKVAGINTHLAELDKPKKRSKYGNRKIEFDGVVFASKKECARYIHLRVLERSGLITELKCQVKFDLTAAGEKIAAYIADFTYQQDGKLVVEDVKSKITRKLPVYRLKKKLMRAVHRIEIQEV